MNQTLNKNITSGLLSGIAAIICMVISAIMTQADGNGIALSQLVLGGLTVGAITFALTFIIGGIIKYAKS